MVIYFVCVYSLFPIKPWIVKTQSYFPKSFSPYGLQFLVSKYNFHFIILSVCQLKNIIFLPSPTMVRLRRILITIRYIHHLSSQNQSNIWMDLLIEKKIRTFLLTLCVPCNSLNNSCFSEKLNTLWFYWIL